jgi:hypothetical protein
MGNYNVNTNINHCMVYSKYLDIILNKIVIIIYEIIGTWKCNQYTKFVLFR